MGGWVGEEEEIVSFGFLTSVFFGGGGEEEKRKRKRQEEDREIKGSHSSNVSTTFSHPAERISIQQHASPPNPQRPFRRVGFGGLRAWKRVYLCRRE